MPVLLSGAQQAGKAAPRFERATYVAKAAVGLAKNTTPMRADCGTPICSAVPGEPPGYSLRVGTLTVLFSRRQPAGRYGCERG